MWKQIKIGEQLRWISEDGIVSKYHRVGFMKPSPDKDGYLKLAFQQGGRTVNFILHRVVYEAFVGPIPAGYTVDHVDGNKLNNHPDNLQLFTPEENAAKGNEKRWKAVSPEGVVYKFANLEKFCREFGLHASHMREVANGKNCYGVNVYSYKGWKCYYD